MSAISASKRPIRPFIIPEDLHEAAREFFDDAEWNNLGPNYKCLFIDPYWGIEKIKGSLKP